MSSKRKATGSAEWMDHIGCEWADGTYLNLVGLGHLKFAHSQGGFVAELPSSVGF